MKRQTRKQIFADLADGIKAMREGTQPKRQRAKDGSIPTHPVVPVPNLSEATVLKMCMAWLKKHRVCCNRNNVGAGCMGESGFYSYGIKDGGDIIGLLPSGKHFEIECKAGKGGRLSMGQQERHRKIYANKGLYFVCHGVEELEYYLGRYL